MKYSSDLRAGFISSLPIFAGYMAMATSFGFIFETSGFPWYIAVLMSAFVFAGASQFVALTLLLKDSSILSIALATFLVNLRHIFYGISLVDKFHKKLPKKAYTIYCLTDEVYSILTGQEKWRNSEHAFYVAMFAHIYWILGTLIGALMGHYITLDLTFLKFSLTAFFIVLTIEQAYTVKNLTPFLIAIAAILIAIVATPNVLLFGAIGISCATLMVQNFFRPKGEK